MLGEFPLTKIYNFFIRIREHSHFILLAATKLLKFIAKLFKFTLNCSRGTISTSTSSGPEKSVEGRRRRMKHDRMQHLINSLESEKKNIYETTMTMAREHRVNNIRRCMNFLCEIHLEAFLVNEKEINSEEEEKNPFYRVICSE